MIGTKYIFWPFIARCPLFRGCVLITPLSQSWPIIYDKAWIWRMKKGCIDKICIDLQRCFCFFLELHTERELGEPYTLFFSAISYCWYCFFLHTVIIVKILFTYTWPHPGSPVRSWIVNRACGERSSMWCVRQSSYMYFAFDAWSITELRINLLKVSTLIVNHWQSLSLSQN